MAAEPYTTDADEECSLLFLIVDAVAFWMRSPLLFWIVTLPIAALAAALAYLFESNQVIAPFRNHWGGSALSALIYTFFLDRWIKASLLDGASPCDEVDNLRRSVISPRFVLFGGLVFALAFGMKCTAGMLIEANVVAWSAGAAIVALYLPALSAAEPMSLRQAFEAGRQLQAAFFLLIAGSIAVALFAGVGIERAAALLPPKAWMLPAVAAAGQVVNCLMLAIAGHALASAFQQVTGWRQPEPDDHPYRNMRLARQKTASH